MVKLLLLKYVCGFYSRFCILYYALQQMRRSGNNEENKRIVMDIEVVIKSHDCPYIVQCLGCFITEPEVWICMELMATCFDKLLKRLKQPIPEYVLGKVTVAVSCYIFRLLCLVCYKFISDC